MKKVFMLAIIVFIVMFSIGLSMAETLDESINNLNSELRVDPIDAWKYQIGDIAGAEGINFDDSSWQVVDPEFDWGPDKICWFRKTITIPSESNNIPIAGSPVYFVAGIDDLGTCYVNGKLMQEFTWDTCRVLLTENAIPGEKFQVAIRGENGPGGGRIMFAHLESQAVLDWRNKTNTLRSEIALARQMIDNEKDTNKKQNYADLLDKAVQTIDINSITNKDMTAFDKSYAQFISILEPMSKDIKEYTVHLIGHGHIDMNWLWLWPETIQVCNDTFTSVLKLMDIYPDFKYSQSQASTYVVMEELFPDKFKQIQQKVKDGQWEVTGGTWVEGDMNMASGESIVRQILYAKRYFIEKFGVEPEIAWEPDTFGHAWSVPQILVKSGLKYYYFCRCVRDQRVFWWQGIDGSRVLAYNFNWYTDSINENNRNVPIEINRMYGVKDGMVVYGVGDHGGGPTMKDLAKAKELQKQQLFPTMKFNTTKNFYETLLSKKTDWPVINDELNFVFRGCYTSQAEIKKINRNSENLLPLAETFSVLAMPYGYSYPQTKFVEAWRDTCFNQFHDIFDGTSIHDAYDHSYDLYAKISQKGNDALNSSLQVLTRSINTEGKGIPVVVFNSMAWKRDDIVTVAIPSSLNGKNIMVTNANGYSLVSQSDGDNISFVAKNVPSLGYKTFYLVEGTKPSTKIKTDNYTIENDFFTVKVDPKKGNISSIYDKKAKREIVTSNASMLQILMEKPHGMSAWELGPVSQTIDLDKAESVEMIENGALRKIIRVKHKFNKSNFIQDITLHTGIPRIDIKFQADWQEKGSSETDAPFLKVSFPTNINDGKAFFEIPFAAMERPANGDEYPSQKWMDLSDDDYGVSILNDCKYGTDINGNVMRLSLIRASYEPDPIPNIGQHTAAYSIYPHKNDWRKADTVRRGYEFNNPLIPVVTTNHKGELPSAHSFLHVMNPNIIVTAFKKAEDSNDIIIRFYESQGVSGATNISFGMNVKSIQETDLAERPGNNPTLTLNRNKITVPFNKWEIKTFKLKLQ